VHRENGPDKRLKKPLQRLRGFRILFEIGLQAMMKASPPMDSYIHTIRVIMAGGTDGICHNTRLSGAARVRRHVERIRFRRT